MANHTLDLWLGIFLYPKKGGGMDAQTLREVMGSTLPNGGYTKLIDAYNNAARTAI